ncbi:MAG: isoprenylcysteine carboxylmethyltransferase family protein [Methylococcaceae bacterium]|nr:isoprenylcysteine carboxylmethyltransferase family protein [Methylococcaceae bacterium]
MLNLELRIPPPFVALLTIPLMWLLSNELPTTEFLGSGRITIAFGISLLGIAFIRTGVTQFKRMQTTITPRRPEEASILVTNGIYIISRNPMYVGLMLVLLGWAAFLASPISLAGPVAFIAYITRFQIKPEERILLAKFDDEYQKYLSSARRWI